ncbi:MAG: copper chaperone PCu(A)C [Burkholderiales bacterium]|nr:copper chaperone PCu(A)C [Burkholderiales bacterium]
MAAVGLLAASLAVHAAAPAPAVSASAVAKQGLVQVEGAWIRATVKGQSATGGFMDLTSSQALTLVGFETNVAKHAELHEMAMEGDVMRMRALDALPLPAGATVSLKPGAHHLMLTDLKRPLSEGETVSLTLLLKGADGQVRKQTVSVPVKAMHMAHPHSDHEQHAH